MKLLIAEDSPRLRTSLTLGLTKLGYAVDAVANGREALRFITGADYDLIVLDIMLPELDGLTVLQQLRARHIKTHVLILSAKDQVQDRISGLQLGADDYLVKPFSFDELQARIAALLRRTYDKKCPLLKLGELEFNTALKELRLAGALIKLTPHELSLLEYLMMNRGRVLDYDQLVRKLYNSDSPVSRNAIEVHVSSLRKKLKAYGADDVIKTRRGFGYYVDAH
ncbi:MAG: response regulator transcription factor [Gammaproteobacteria bacterium]|nr:response regulator transcription factor [Gammaproteobacteria bacterium]